DRTPSTSSGRIRSRASAVGADLRAWREQILKSKGHVRLDRVGSLDAASGQPLCDKEGELERLVAVESWVAECLVPTHGVSFNQVVPTTDALSHIVAGELDVHTSWPGAEVLVDVEEAVQLGHHIRERASLVTVASLESIAMHRVADPRHLPAAGGDLCNDVWQHVSHFACAHPRDECDPSRFMIRIEAIGQVQPVVRGGFRA